MEKKSSVLRCKVGKEKMKGRKIKYFFRENPVYVKAGLLAAAAVFIFSCVYIYDNGKKIEKDAEGREILRRSKDGNEESRRIQVKIDDRKEEINLSVSGEKYDEEELKQAFSMAKEEVEKAALGDNKTFDEVRKDLNLITSLPEKKMTVSWELDHYDVIDVQGHIRQDKLEEEGTLVKLTAILTYEDQKEIHEFYAKVFPPKSDRTEEELRQLKEEIKKADEQTKTEDYLILPDKVNGKKVLWEYGVQKRAYGILVMGIGFAAFLVVSSEQKMKEEKKKAIKQMKMDYPHIINKFNLYIRSGMTIRRAWFQIAEEYEKKQREKEQVSGKICGRKKAYEEMIITMYQIRGGVSEGECYEEYGTRCDLSEYRKFGMMLSQNLRKGTKGLTELLAREGADAFEQRKNTAKKTGEEAGTKLMIPLFIMLIIVFAIVIVPAFFSIQI